MYLRSVTAALRRSRGLQARGAELGIISNQIMLIWLERRADVILPFGPLERVPPDAPLHHQPEERRRSPVTPEPRPLAPVRGQQVIQTETQDAESANRAAKVPLIIYLHMIIVKIPKEKWLISH